METIRTKKAIQVLFRRCGFELRRYRRHIPHEERSITLGQLASLDFGEITMEEARFLGDLVRRAPMEGPIIEIGTLFGWSTRIITMAKPVEQPLITVDNCIWNPWGLSPEEHRWLTEKLLADAVKQFHVTQRVMDKDRFFNQYDGLVPSLVFMDADHSYEGTRRDLEFARRVKTSVICGHDYDKTKWPGVVKAVDEFGGPKELVGSLWVLEKECGVPRGDIQANT